MIMKNFNFFFNLSKSVIASLFLLVIMNACTSQYHWVKLKSANPNLVKKEDMVSQTPSATEIATIAPSPTVKTEEKFEKLVPAVPHGLASINPDALNQKAREISKGLSPERISALNSSDLKIRTQAVKETLHEQLLKNANYSKLSSEKQAKIESKISAKISKAGVSKGDQIWGINKLIVYGLALWVIGILFLFIFWPLGLLIELAGSIIFIIGLIQQFS